VKFDPGAALGGPTLFTARLAPGLTVRVSVELLLLALVSVTPPGAVTLAVLVRVPTPWAVPVTVNVMDAFAGSVTASLMSPVPYVDDALAPTLVVAALHVGLANPVGNASVTVAPVTAAGPLLSTVIV